MTRPRAPRPRRSTAQRRRSRSSQHGVGPRSSRLAPGSRRHPTDRPSSHRPRPTTPSAASAAAPRAQVRGANAATQRQRDQDRAGDDRVARLGPDRLRPVGQQGQREQARDLPRPGVQVRESWGRARPPRRGRLQPAVASRGTSDHHSPRPAVSRVRSQPTSSRTSHDASASPPMPYAATGTCRRSSTASAASTGTATVVADGGVLGQPGVGVRGDEGADHGDGLDAEQASDRLGRAQMPTPRPSRRGCLRPAPRCRARTGRPARPGRRLRRDQVQGEHAGDDQPERLGCTSQVLAGEHDGDQGQQPGDPEEDQRATGEAQGAPGHRDEDDRSDQQTQGAEGEQHHRHRGRRVAAAAACGGAGWRSSGERRQPGRAGRRGRRWPGPAPESAAELLDEPVGRDIARPQLGRQRAGDLASRSRAGRGRVRARRGSPGRWWGRRVCSCPGSSRPGAAHASGARLNSC